jgi:hypothetical protein
VKALEAKKALREKEDRISKIKEQLRLIEADRKGGLIATTLI